MTIRTAQCPQCGADGSCLESGVADYFFGSPSTWDYYRCSRAGCGVAWPFPAPNKAQLNAAYSHYYTHDVRSSGGVPTIKLAIARALQRVRGIKGPPAGLRPAIAGWLVEECWWSAGGIPALADGLIVDIGCGNGDRMRTLNAFGWKHVVGIEPDPLAVEAGRARELDVRLASAENLPLDDGVADAVMLHHVIEHVDEPGIVVREAHRVLKAGGRMIIVTPNIEGAMRTRWGKYWRGFEAPRHLTIFALDALVPLLISHGFAIELGRTSARSSAWIDDVSRAARDGPSARGSLLNRLRRLARVFSEQQRQIKLGNNSGEELVVVARKLESA